MQILIDALNSKLGLLLIGFGLTTLFGNWLATKLQRATWARQTKLDLFRSRYTEGIKALDQLSTLIDQRHFALQRYFWAIKEKADSEQLRTKENDYFQIVKDWNGALRSNRNKIRLLVGDEQANKFLDYGDDYKPDAPESLHYQFVRAHNAVMTAKSQADKYEAAQEEVTKLNWSCSILLENLTTEFAKRAASLELLEVPEVSIKKRKD